jgi:hypothetical protein
LLQDRELADDDGVMRAGIDLRQQIEDDTDQLCTRIWRSYGTSDALALAEALEPPCDLLLKRVDETAGPIINPRAAVVRLSSHYLPPTTLDQNPLCA